MMLIDDNPKDILFGCTKSAFEISEDFDEIDIGSDSKEEIFPI